MDCHRACTLACCRVKLLCARAKSDLEAPALTSEGVKVLSRWALQMVWACASTGIWISYLPTRALLVSTGITGTSLPVEMVSGGTFTILAVIVSMFVCCIHTLHCKKK